MHGLVCVHLPYMGIETDLEAKLKKVCGSTNMDIFFTGGRADFFFLNIFFSTCKYTVLPLDQGVVQYHMYMYYSLL